MIMQNVQEVLSSDSHGVDKSVEPPSPTDDLDKKIRVSQPQDPECRKPKLPTDRDQSPPVHNHSDKLFSTSTVVADKYLLLEQAEGSSLYRCVDVKTKEELVCKVNIIFFNLALATQGQ